LNSDSIKLSELIYNRVSVSNHSTGAARETSDRTQTHPIPIIFALLQPFMYQVASDQYVFASQSGTPVLSMPMLLGGVRVNCIIDTGAAGLFYSSVIHWLLRSEASSSYRRAPARTLSLNTADGLFSAFLRVLSYLFLLRIA
jgi:hypothetical protein